jgi:L-asparaginase type II
MKPACVAVAAWALAVGCATSCAAQAIQKSLPIVWVLSTGGTISGRGASPTALAECKTGSLLGRELVAGVPEIAQYADVKVEQLLNISSPDITLDNWLTIARRINRIFADDPKAAGVVITHGTSTLEETAYFLNLTVKDDRPVVLVGAQRPASAISADGPLNLLNAIRTAAAPDARGKGVMIVMNDEINASREVTKTNTYRVRRSVRRSWGSSATSMPTRSLSIARRPNAIPRARSSTSRRWPHCPKWTSSIRTSSRTRRWCRPWWRAAIAASCSPALEPAR